jgi:hypothetical protein
VYITITDGTIELSLKLTIIVIRRAIPILKSKFSCLKWVKYSCRSDSTTVWVAVYYTGDTIAVKAVAVYIYPSKRLYKYYLDFLVSVQSSTIYN